MTTFHSTFEFVGGDDWEIQATLLDENGNPYNLSGTPNITWTLVNTEGQRVVNVGEYTVTVINATAGTCSILIPGTKTTNIRGGQFIDALRIVAGGVTSTLSTGPVHVTADPWRLASGYQFSDVTLRVVA